MRPRAILILTALLAPALLAQTPPDLLQPSATYPATTQSTDPIARIRAEGLDHSQVAATLSYLSDVIGPRVTGSPGLKRANVWTQSQFEKYGLQNAHLEPWGPFGRGWTLRRFSLQVTDPQSIPLIAYPKAWSPGLDRPTESPVIHLDAQTLEQLQKYHGKLRGAAVLVGPLREVQARFDPLAIRLTDSDLLKLANSDGSTQQTTSAAAFARTVTPGERQALLANTPMARLATTNMSPDGKLPATQPTTASTRRAATQMSPARVIDFLITEGAALVITPSPQGDGGTVFVSSATLPMNAAEAAATHPSTTSSSTSRAASNPFGDAPKPWSADARPTLPQVVVAVEQYNRMLRMIQQGESLKVLADLQVDYQTDDPMAYNTIAEIPGSDLADQIVMLGAHLDSWHTGTGATDNGAGCATVMEAVRILKAANLRPRRTIRVALWTGEEEGLYGSKAYVEQHFGKVIEPTTRPANTQPAGPRPTPPPTQSSVLSTQSSSSRPTPKRIARGPEFDRLSVYFNLDNGTGAIHGIYLQGNEAARPLFRQWLAPFADLGAATITPNNTGGTDHLSFTAIGLPGFQFIQDPLEYWSRTHHSNMDVYDRIQPNDLKQASTIMAAFIYEAAMTDDRFPRP